MSDGEWKRLLVGIKGRSVIPIVGEAVTTFGPEDTPLYGMLAQTLAERLSLPKEELSAQPTLHEVACARRLAGGAEMEIYGELAAILEEGAFIPGPTLERLGEVGFQLYLTTTFDPLLRRAVEKSRNLCDVAGFSPNAANKDLACPLLQLQRPTVYHLLGRCGEAGGSFVAWDHDLLEFLAALARFIGSEGMRNLADGLRDVSFLALGLGLSDWVLRLLLRIAGQDESALVKKGAWLAEGGRLSPTDPSVIFFSSVNKSIHTLPYEPRAFVSELHRRWKEKYPQPVAVGIPTPSLAPVPPDSVFISYAREDYPAASAIADQLRAAGCEVYMDLERLHIGHDFDQELARQVCRDCAVFLSVVSKTTEAASDERYFHRERNWAAKRLDDRADVDKPKFYLRFCVDIDAPKVVEREPRATSTHENYHCPNGAVSKDVAALVRSFQLELKHASSSLSAARKEAQRGRAG